MEKTDKNDFFKSNLNLPITIIHIYCVKTPFLISLQLQNNYY